MCQHISLIFARQQRLTTKNSYIFPSSGKFSIDITEKCINYVVVHHFLNRIVTFLIAVRTGKVARVIRHKKQLDFIFLTLFREIKISQLKSPFFLCFVNQIAFLHKLATRIQFVFQHFYFVRTDYVSRFTQRIDNEKIFRVSNGSDDIVIG